MDELSLRLLADRELDEGGHRIAGRLVGRVLALLGPARNHHVGHDGHRPHAGLLHLVVHVTHAVAIGKHRADRTRDRARRGRDPLAVRELDGHGREPVLRRERRVHVADRAVGAQRRVVGAAGAHGPRHRTFTGHERDGVGRIRQHGQDARGPGVWVRRLRPVAPAVFVRGPGRVEEPLGHLICLLRRLASADRRDRSGEPHARVQRLDRGDVPVLQLAREDPGEQIRRQRQVRDLVVCDGIEQAEPEHFARSQDRRVSRGKPGRLQGLLLDRIHPDRGDRERRPRLVVGDRRSGRVLHRVVQVEVLRRLARVDREVPELLVARCRPGPAERRPASAGACVDRPLEPDR